MYAHLAPDYLALGVAKLPSVFKVGQKVDIANEEIERLLGIIDNLLANVIKKFYATTKT